MSSGGGDKTEKATPKKRRDAREDGQILRSTEVNTAFTSIVMAAFLLAASPAAIRKIGDIIGGFLTSPVISESVEITIPNIQVYFTNIMWDMAVVILPVLGVALVAGVFINVIQVGFMFTTKTLSPKMERINPMKGFQRIFSTRTLTELVKSIIKIIALGYVLYGEYLDLLDVFPRLIGTELYTSFIEILSMTFRIALKMGLVLAVIAGADYLFQWWKYEKDLSMTKQEIKDEYKLTEGDPQIKSRIRQKQRQMSAMRMMDRVPGADVVITNPTHYAIALKYEESRDNAPVVVAKGADFLARKIKEIAAEHGVQMVENRPLAQALYSMCEVDSEIPAEFYQAVADILVFVFKQKQNLDRRRGYR